MSQLRDTLRGLSAKLIGLWLYLTNPDRLAPHLLIIVALLVPLKVAQVLVESSGDDFASRIYVRHIDNHGERVLRTLSEAGNRGLTRTEMIGYSVTRRLDDTSYWILIGVTLSVMRTGRSVFRKRYTVVCNVCAAFGAIGYILYAYSTNGTFFAGKDGIVLIIQLVEGTSIVMAAALGMYAWGSLLSFAISSRNDVSQPSSARDFAVACFTPGLVSFLLFVFVGWARDNLGIDEAERGLGQLDSFSKLVIVAALYLIPLLIALTTWDSEFRSLLRSPWHIIKDTKGS